MAVIRVLIGKGSIQLRMGPRGRKLGAWSTSFPTCRPFLKWTGGKQWLSPLGDQLLPAGFEGTYYELFVGGGALFFACRPLSAVLSDANPELMASYRGVRDELPRVLRELRSYAYDEETFFRLRVKKPRSDATAAARFIYLNRAAFNGIYRVNRRGEFNVPFGRYVNPTICQPDRLELASAVLQSVDLRCADFEDTAAAIRSGDFVYLDPPYITGHQNNGFVKYNARLFSWNDQERLAATALTLVKKGAAVLVSNANHPNVWRMYRGMYRYTVERTGLISGSVRSRRRITETLLSSYPLLGVPSERVT